MTLNKFFTRAYCISLPERTDRRAHCQRVFAELDWKVEFFDASKAIYTWARTEPTQAALNCAHIAILSECLLRNVESVVIFEDDILVRKGTLTQIEDYLDSVPDVWELCYLGWMDWLEHRQSIISSSVKIVSQMDGAHAFGIRRDVMLNYIMGLAQMDDHCDGVLAKKIQSRGYAYAPLTNLVTQGCFGSDHLFKPEILSPDKLKEYV